MSSEKAICATWDAIGSASQRVMSKKSGKK
jgi:hypothetical protein